MYVCPVTHDPNLTSLCSSVHFTGNGVPIRTTTHAISLPTPLLTLYVFSPADGKQDIQISWLQLNMPKPSLSSPAVSKPKVKKESTTKHPSGAKKRRIAIECDDDEIQCLGSRPIQAYRAERKDGDAVEYLRTVHRRSASRDEAVPRPKKITKKSSPVKAREEVRLSSFRTAPPALFYTKLARATSQR